MRHPSRPAHFCGPQFSLRHLAFAVHLAVSAIGVTACFQAAHAAEITASTQKNVNIAAGPLGRTLSIFATTHDVLLSFDPILTEGKSSNGLQGSYSLQQGFSILLNGSGLEATRQPNGSFLLKKNDATTSQANDAVLPTVHVTSLQDDSNSYAVRSTHIGKSTQSLREIPQSVSVITRQRLDEQNITDLATALELTTGVTTSQIGLFDAQFFSRGFAMTNMQIDGGAPLTMGLAGFQTQQDFSQYERVEVLRGADGLFGGAGEPGGTVNLVRKRALPHFQMLFNASAGSWNNYRTDIDITSPLTQDGSIRGRVVASYGDRNFFYDVAKQKREMLYGVIEADLTRDTTVSAGFTINRMSGTPWFLGLPRYADGSDIGLPRSTSLTTTWSRIKVDTNEYFAKLDQRLNDDWQLKANIARNEQDSYRKYARAIGSPGTSTIDGRIVDLAPTQTVADINVNGRFDLFGRTHQVVFGGDWQETTGSSTLFRSTSLPTDIFNFDHDGYINPTGIADVQNSQWGQKQYGIYGNLKLQLSDQTKLIFGARRASYKYNQVTGTGAVTRYNESAVVTPYTGVVYDLGNRWSAYASFAETYKSQASSLQGPLPGTPLDPITGRNYEVGMKGELFEGKLNAALALYRIERNGQAVLDPDYATTPGIDGSSCCYLSTGRIVSQGVDAEISGEVLPRLQAFAGYTFNDNENKDGNARYSTVTPRHLFKLWTMYQLPGNLAQWKLGGGTHIQSASYVTGTIGGTPYNFTQSGYAVWNARAEYALNKTWTASLNINNLFDKTYYQTVGYATYYNWYGEPRNATLAIRGKF